MFKQVRLYEWIAIAALLIGGIAWAARLEARVGSLERGQDRNQVILEDVRDQLARQASDLAYIRGRLDAVLREQQRAAAD